ncbi:MAG: DUF4886 domain-containing protein [Kiritimatiellae bacterium]|jgi:hypothetical protein|nr:DUF4886 domain-containing protein [Kiritimatiellia bacterium]
MRKVLLVVMLVVAFCVSSLVAEETNKTVKLLTIGNSFADNACSMLGNITRSVPGCDIQIKKANIGGCYLEKHAQLIKACEENPELKPYYKKYTLKQLLKTNDWDVVTIQQVSHKSYKPETYQPYADEIVAYVNTNAPQAEVVIHQTWAYAPDCNRLPGFGISRDQMHEGLTKCYKKLSDHYKGMRMLPSGSAFYASYAENPDIDLWNPNDRFHANQNGCYLAGCVWFGELFGISPEKVAWKPGSMSEENAAKLRKIAAKVIGK